MRRYTFYLSVALLAFGIGLFVVFKFDFKYKEQSLNVEKIETATSVSEFKIKDEKIKYGCEDKELVPFWEKLDKDEFLKFKSREIKLRNTDAEFTSFPHSADALRNFENEWNNFQIEFACAYFNGIDKDVGLMDLDNDGEKEIFVIGAFSGYHAEKELLVFQNKNGAYKLILFNIGNQDTEIKANKTNGFYDIETRSSFSGGGRSINTFKFNGRNYEERSCHSENTVVRIRDAMTKVDDPIIKRENCYQKFSNILKKL